MRSTPRRSNSKQLKGLKLAGAYNERGVILSGLGRKQDAIAEFTLAINVLPRQPYYYGNRARTYMTLKQPAKAAADFGKVIEFSTKPSGFAYFDRCQAYAAAKMRDKAIADCEKALELKPKHSRAKALLALLKKGG